MQLSIVIPLLNEAESLPELYEWIADVMQKHQFTYEVIFIDDGSNDTSWEIITILAHSSPNIKGIRFRRNFGKSQALHAGFKLAQGEVVITMDADLQDSPDEIPELYQMIVKQHYDIVSGWKKKRFDNKLTKNLPSKLFNAVARITSGLKLHDFNCGLKAYRKDVIKTIEVYGEMHRYIPILAKNEGFRNITEKEVKHQMRKYGTTKFGVERFINGFLDLITLWFLNKFGKRPMHFFGALGIFMFIVGFIATFGIGASKLYKLWKHIPDILVTQNPWFYIALTMMLMGTFFFLCGFLGEIILRSQNHEKRYKVAEYLNNI